MKLQKFLKAISILWLISLLVVDVSADFTSAVTSVKNLLSRIVCVIVVTAVYIAGAIAILIIVINGIKWTTSSDDPGARKKAREGVVHAVIGLIIVLLAATIIGMITGAAETKDIITACKEK